MKDVDCYSSGLSVNDREAIMRHALDLARHAMTKGELPIAAVLCDGVTILCEGHNEVTSTYLDAHAEAGVVHGAKRLLQSMKLTDRNRLTLYSTLEPCFMCCGIAMTWHIGTVCYALESPHSKRKKTSTSFRRHPR